MSARATAQAGANNADPHGAHGGATPAQRCMTHVGHAHGDRVGAGTSLFAHAHGGATLDHTAEAA